MRLGIGICCVAWILGGVEATLKEEDQRDLFFEVLLQAVEVMEGRDLPRELSEMLDGWIRSEELQEALMRCGFLERPS